MFGHTKFQLSINCTFRVMKLLVEITKYLHFKFDNSERKSDRELKFCVSKHLQKMCLETKFQPVRLRNDRDIERATWRAKEQLRLLVTVLLTPNVRIQKPYKHSVTLVQLPSAPNWERDIWWTSNFFAFHHVARSRTYAQKNILSSSTYITHYHTIHPLSCNVLFGCNAILEETDTS